MRASAFACPPCCFCPSHSLGPSCWLATRRGTRKRYLFAPLFAGAIGGFCGPYVVGALVNRGGYVTCMQVLGGLFLVEAAMMFGEVPAHSVYIIWSSPFYLISLIVVLAYKALREPFPAHIGRQLRRCVLIVFPSAACQGGWYISWALRLTCNLAAAQCTARATSSRRTRRASTKRWHASVPCMHPRAPGTKHPMLRPLPQAALQQLGILQTRLSELGSTLCPPVRCAFQHLFPGQDGMSPCVCMRQLSFPVTKVNLCGVCRIPCFDVACSNSGTRGVPSVLLELMELTGNLSNITDWQGLTEAQPRVCGRPLSHSVSWGFLNQVGQDAASGLFAIVHHAEVMI